MTELSWCGLVMSGQDARLYYMLRMKYGLMTSPCRHMESMQHAVTSKTMAYFRRPHTFFLAIILVHAYENVPFI